MSSGLSSVLVVGGCGFLGHHIVTQLLENSSVQVSVLDLHTTNNRLPSVSYHDGDITSEATVRSVLQKVKPQVIFHTASPTVGLQSVPFYYETNVDGTRNLIECASQFGGVKALVYTSSAGVVHNNVDDLVDADENLPVLRMPQQTEIYAHTKGIAEDLVLASNRKHGDMLTVALRPTSMFGEGDNQLLPRMLQVYYDGKTKFQLGDNTNWFDFVYVGNVAHAHILAAKKLLGPPMNPQSSERVDGEAFFITNGEPLHFWDFAREVWRAAGDQSDAKDVFVLPKGLGLLIAALIEWIFWILFLGQKEPSLTRKKIKFSCMTRTFRIEKAKSRLGYRCEVDIRQGIKKSVKWFEEKRLEGEKER